jgi:hypothetical protein
MLRPVLLILVAALILLAIAPLASADTVLLGVAQYPAPAPYFPGDILVTFYTVGGSFTTTLVVYGSQGCVFAAAPECIFDSLAPGDIVDVGFHGDATWNVRTWTIPQWGSRSIRTFGRSAYTAR